MSVLPGHCFRKDPDAELVYVFDWTDWLGSASIASQSTTITGPDSDLTQDNSGIVSGSKKTTVRLLGGTAGKAYTVTNRITTNEAVPQTDDRSITIQIRAN